MTRRTILSLEQATALPYATLRFVQLGWRVIRIEATGGERPGDPNRYVGIPAIDEGRRATFLGPNVGKESLGLNLKEEAGQALLKLLIEKLGADVFCCNVLPKRYRQLGIDYETLSVVKPDLIWAAISALGPDHPEVGGYDPVIQAMSGLMDVNGLPENPPTLIGLPITDLKSGDELYSSVLLALLERAENGRGKRIDVAMLRAAMSWHIAVMPLVDLGAESATLTRTGNAHRQFVPTNIYPASDGFIYLAIGSDRQWQGLVALPGFEELGNSDYRTLDDRSERRQALYADIGRVTATLTIDELIGRFTSAGLPHSRINDIRTAMELEAVRDKLTATVLPDGRTVRLPPQAVQVSPERSYALPPSFGAHTDGLLAEVGVAQDRIADLRARGIVA